jgi:ABC-type antimicrobial peptide transport system permease subunit
MVVQRGLIIATTGTILGLLGAFLMNRLIQTLLYEVSPTDTATFGIIAGLFLGVATLASFWPARSTTRIDPALALKADG